MITFLQRFTTARVSSPVHFSLRGWKVAFIETKNSFTDKNIMILAAGIAYFSTLAFFPLMAAAVAIAGFVISPDQLQSITHIIESYLPADVASLVTTQLENVTGRQSSNILVAVFAILLSLFSVSGAVGNLITASNVSYDATETRHFIKLRLTSVIFTISFLVLGLIVVGILAMSEPNLRLLHVPMVLAITTSYIRWVLLALLILTGLSLFYRYGPNRDQPRWQWMSWGAVIATLLWLLGTILFFIYARYFANFSKSYSLFAGIIVLMTWFNLSGLIVLLGAQINHRLEIRSAQSQATFIPDSIKKFFQKLRRAQAK